MLTGRKDQKAEERLPHTAIELGSAESFAVPSPATPPDWDGVALEHPPVTGAGVHAVISAYGDLPRIEGSPNMLARWTLK
jgi:hypothetical protein